MRFVILLVATFAAGSSAMLLRQQMDWLYWTYFGMCAAGAVILYIVSVLLMGAYIERRAPEYASREEIVPGLQAWELTAGTGVVPKWVSTLALLGIGCALAIPFEFVARMFR